MKKKLFSLIIPVYQEEKIIESTLKYYDTELREKFNFELIVSDGGSEDRTKQIAEQFADQVVTRGEELRSISAGRNKGAAKVNSDLLVFINADSLPANKIDFLNLLTEIANKQKYKKYAAFACTILPFPEEELFKDKIFYKFFNTYFKLLNIIGVGMGRGECQIIRKEVFEKVGGYNDTIFAGEDFDLFRRIARVGKIRFLDECIIHESTRRFRKDGYIKTLLLWFFNSIFVLLFNKSLSKSWDPVR